MTSRRSCKKQTNNQDINKVNDEKTLNVSALSKNTLQYLIFLQELIMFLFHALNTKHKNHAANFSFRGPKCNFFRAPFKKNPCKSTETLSFEGFKKHIQYLKEQHIIYFNE